MAPYERWYERFKSALESLKSKQQQQNSPLPIIYQWQRPQPAHGAQEYALTCKLTTACMQRSWMLAGSARVFACPSFIVAAPAACATYISVP